MTYQPASIGEDLGRPSKLPVWGSSRHADTLESLAFRSGAVLTVLDGLVSDPGHGVPVALMANRLALSSATATSKLEGRLARETDIRDAYHLAPPGESRGPDGDLLAFWRVAVRLRLGARAWQDGLENVVGPAWANDVGSLVEAGVARARTHGPLAGCAFVVRAVLATDDRAERYACLLSDAVLARALDWPRILPISSQHFTKAMLQDAIADGSGIELKLQSAILASAEDSVRMARGLAERATALRAIAPKLRSKGSEAAVAVFLSEDAVAPGAMLSPVIQGTTLPMTDRSARRFCDRLVELGVVRELTGRPTFRLYGISP